MALTARELAAWLNGLPFTDLISVTRRESEAAYRRRKRRLKRRLISGEIGLGEYASEVRGVAQDHGI